LRKAAKIVSYLGPKISIRFFAGSNPFSPIRGKPWFTRIRNAMKYIPPKNLKKMKRVSQYLDGAGEPKSRKRNLSSIAFAIRGTAYEFVGGYGKKFSF
jgi:hypothetical protein